MKNSIEMKEITPKPYLKEAIEDAEYALKEAKEKSSAAQNLVHIAEKVEKKAELGLFAAMTGIEPSAKVDYIVEHLGMFYRIIDCGVTMGYISYGPNPYIMGLRVNKETLKPINKVYSTAPIAYSKKIFIKADSIKVYDISEYNNKLLQDLLQKPQK